MNFLVVILLSVLLLSYTVSGISRDFFGIIWLHKTPVIKKNGA